MSAAGYARLGRAVVRRELTLFVRYPFEAVGAVVTLTALFGLLFFGGSMLAPRAMADSTAGLVVGYFLWVMAMGSYQDTAGDVMAEASWGTLERHYLTPFGFGTVLLAKSLAKLLVHFVYAGIVLAAMLLITGTTLEIDVLTVLPVAALTLASSFGVGFALGGVTVLYKNVTSWLEMVGFVMAGLIAVPAFGGGYLFALPLAQGSALLQRAMRDGVRLWEFDPVALAVLVVTGVGYLSVGYGVFYLCQRRARRLGVLGDY